MWMLYIFEFNHDDTVDTKITFYETINDAENELYKLALEHYKKEISNIEYRKYFKKYKPKLGIREYDWNYSYKLYIYECVSGKTIDFEHGL
jgi:hypothetical protein